MKIIVIILILLLLACLAGGYYVFKGVFEHEDHSRQPIDWNSVDSDTDLMRPTAGKYYEYREPLMERFRQLPFEVLNITSFDGLKLQGYLLKGNPKEVVILVHGFKGSPAEDYSERIAIYQQRGSTILLVDDRAHGCSEGKYIGFSELDRFDVASWVDKINEMYDDPKIYLHGVSMGGATVIHCADMKLKNVCGIVDDCGFDSILNITKALMKDTYHMPYFPLGYCSWLWSILLAKVSYNTSTGIRNVQNTDIPILFIHGEEDHFVPCEMSKSLYDNCASPKELHLIPGCGHAAAYMMAKDEYTQAVNRLLDGEIK